MKRRFEGLVLSVGKKILADFFGRFPPGTRLPSEGELAKRYAVSRRTIRAALTDLDANNWVERKPSGRVFIAPYCSGQWRDYLGKLIGISFRSATGWFSDRFCLAVMQAMTKELHRTNLDIKFTTQNWLFPHGDAPPAAHFASADVVGLIMVGKHPEAVWRSFQTLEKPLVAVDVNLSDKGVNSFCFDNFAAGRFLAERLLKSGHRRIAGVFESPGKPLEKQDDAWRERQEGFLSAFAAKGLNAPEQVFLTQRLPDETLLREIRCLLQKPPDIRPTALYLPTDWSEQVGGLATELGLRIPKNLTLVGCADHGESGTMTAMRFNGEDLGYAAAKRLLLMIRDPKWRKRKTILSRLNGRYLAGKTHATVAGRASRE